MHGEFAVVNNLDKMAINASGQGFTTQSDALSQLIGLRYLSERETTYILEYYHNGAGYSRSQIKDFITFVDRSYRTFQNTGNDSGLARAAGLLDGPYGQPNFGRHYLYFRASQKEPFDILYFTPAITSIMNLTDASLTVIPELAYSPMTNLEFASGRPSCSAKTARNTERSKTTIESNCECATTSSFESVFPGGGLIFLSSQQSRGCANGIFFDCPRSVDFEYTSADDYYSREFIHRVFAIVKEAVVSPAAI